MSYMSHLGFIFDWATAFFSMPLTLPFIAGIAFISFEILANKIFRG